MTLNDLRYIVALADHGHFGRAATACNVSQPTLSGQILKLEAELGLTLFDRGGREVRVAERADPIVFHARAALANCAELIGAARAARDPLVGELRLGMIPTIAPYLLPHALPHLAENLPKAPVRLLEDLTERLVARLKDDEIDAAVLATDVDSDRIASVALYDEAFLLVVGRAHPFAGRASIAPSDVDPDSLLLLADGHCFRDQTLRLCAARSAEGSGRGDMSAASLETLLRLTVAGHGVTFAPKMMVFAWGGLERELRAIPLEGPGVSRHVKLAFRRDTPRRAAIDALAGAIRLCAGASGAVTIVPATMRG
jgi:LysR family hydrogen peroxide-inducible transcriptional activator